MLEKKRESWFKHWILENKPAVALMFLFLILLNIFMFTKVRFVLEPVGQFIAIVGLPILLAVVLYYMLNPIVNLLERLGVNRIVAIAGIFVLLSGLIVWGIVVLVPNIQEQTRSFFENVPKYMKILDEKSTEIVRNDFFAQYREEINNVVNSLSNNVSEWAKGVSKNLVSGVGNFLGTLTAVVVGIITMPFILFYLLKDGTRLLPAVLRLLPISWRKTSKSILVEVNDQLASYIRGQLTVAICVAIMFIIGFKIIGLDYAVTLGISAGALNLIPYLGSFLAMIPAVLLGIVAGPIMLVKVLVTFVIEQTLEGRFIAPLVLGNQMDIHPVTILLVLLTSGKVGGLMGVIIGIPVYATIRVVVTHAYQWHRKVSGLYEEEAVVEESEN